MASGSGAQVPEDASLAELSAAAAGCTACDLHLTGTQTVFGEGAEGAVLVLVGEQPGDVEDREGRPFVGPAGQELDRALEAAGLDEVPQYRTNVVKHFKWQERRGKRRIHETPNRIEIRACLPWLQAELSRTTPDVIVPLGATATQGLLGWDVRITRARGRLHVGPERLLALPTVHPSSVLRARSDDDRREAREAFHDDLRRVAAVVEHGPRAALERATVDELRELAAALDVPVRSRDRKSVLVESVAEALEGNAANPAAPSGQEASGA